MSRHRHCWIALTVALATVAGRVHAQRISGTIVREAAGTPIAGAVVLLLGETRDSTLARGTTSTTGRFQFTVPAVGAYRIRVLRLGQRPHTSAALRVGASGFNEQITVPEQPIQLARFDVKSSAGCQRNPAPGSAVGQLLAEARTAFLASVSMSPDGEPRATYRKYRRAESRGGEVLRPEESAIAVLATARPFVAIPADSLARVGYMVVEPDSTAYYAPDAEVLLSDSFARAHCFMVVQGDSTRADALGIEFRPVIRRDGRKDIRGTIWMRPSSTSLHEVSYRYDPPTPEERAGRIGGTVQFDTTSAGIWFVRHWEIRMAVLSQQSAADYSRRMPSTQVFQRLEQVHVSGGAVMDVRVANVLQFADSAEIQRATQAVRVLAEAQRAARETLERQADAGFLTDLCGTLRAPDRGAVTGQVLSPSGAPMANVPVRASWRVVLTDGVGTNPYGYRDDRAETLTMSNGRFVLCPIPLESNARVAVVVDGREFGATPVSIGSDLLYARVPISIPLAQLALIASAASRSDPFARAARLAEGVTASAGAPSDRAHAEVDERIRRGVPNSALQRVDLERDRPPLLSDAMRSMSGIEIVAANGGAIAVSRRSGARGGGATGVCRLRVLVNNVLRPADTSLDVVAPSDIYAVELYVGATRIPPQFGGFRGELDCGLVAVWTLTR